MTDSLLAQRAVAQIRRLRRELDLARRGGTNEIAIVGAACRLPGGMSTIEDIHPFLASGVDAVGEIPAERWDAAALLAGDEDRAGTIRSMAAAHIDGIEEFDPELFGISPREAPSIDPHHRLLLELANEAFEDAGYRGRDLVDRPVGVFVGVMPSDYGRLRTQGDLAAIDRYFTTGTDISFASGRISYTFGLRGPCLTLDTACSSSMVALHLAVQSLRAGESELALVASASLILSPDLNVFLSRAGALSPRGRCHTFDSRADGFVRGEGGVAFLLRRVRDAESAGDSIRAVIRGTAMNHDGRSAGITVPSGTAQAELVRAALANADTSPDELGYLEAHGTGTAIGDPIELGALADALRTRSPRLPKILVGSMKTHIGHLDAAAGLAGLAKVCALLDADEIPPPLHQRTPNPRVRWDELPLRVSGASEKWPLPERVAGVSAFGMSGTNVHAIVARRPRSVPTSRGAAEAEAHSRSGDCVLGSRPGGNDAAAD